MRNYPIDLIFLIDTGGLSDAMVDKIRDAISMLCAGGRWHDAFGEGHELRAKVCAMQSRLLGCTPFAVSQDVFALQLNSIRSEYGNWMSIKNIADVFKEVLRIDGMPLSAVPDIWRWHHKGKSLRKLFLFVGSEIEDRLGESFVEYVVNELCRRRIHMTAYAAGASMDSIEDLLEADRAEGYLLDSGEGREISTAEIVDQMRRSVEVSLTPRGTAVEVGDAVQDASTD